MKPERNRPVAGFVWMLVTGFLFVGVTATVKHLGDRIPAPEAAFLRYLLGLVFFLPVLGTLRAAPLGRRALALFSLRGFVHALGVMLWFYAMTQIPLAEVTALNYLSPVYVTVLAALFLGETLAWPRITAIVVALAGVLVILRPGFREVSPGHVAMLGTAILFSVSYLVAKIVTDEFSPLVVVAMLSLTVTVCLAPFAITVWVWPSWDELGWLFLVACLATTGHLTMTFAFRDAPITVTQPVTFLQLVWATALGWLAFGERVDAFVVTGGLTIIGSVLVITIREARRRGKEPPPMAP